MQKFISRQLIKLSNKFFTYFESIWYRNVKLNYPPIFILGAPRSGSTLLFQLITSAFNVGYLSNLHCRFYCGPAFIEKLNCKFKHKYLSDYSSNHGDTKLLTEPSECGAFWYRFFLPAINYTKITNIESKKMDDFRRNIAAISKERKNSIVFKNLYAALRIEPIVDVIPEALFIIINRDETDNAHSILDARMRVNGNYEEWWSLPTQELEQLKCQPAEVQVVKQIRNTYKIIESDLTRLNVRKHKILTINYEELCDDVYEQLDKIEVFFKDNNKNIKRTNNIIPKTFQRNKQIKIDPQLYQSLKNYINREQL
ncbi:MAG: sulfotransferase [Gammaproteobacteria bacterium]|nr:sulfotransferase [Gammaproteobacteria bacterium]